MPLVTTSEQAHKTWEYELPHMVRYADRQTCVCVCLYQVSFGFSTKPIHKAFGKQSYNR